MKGSQNYARVTHKNIIFITNQPIIILYKSTETQLDQTRPDLDVLSFIWDRIRYNNFTHWVIFMSFVNCFYVFCHIFNRQGSKFVKKFYELGWIRFSFGRDLLSHLSDEIGYTNYTARSSLYAFVKLSFVFQPLLKGTGANFCESRSRVGLGWVLVKLCKIGIASGIVQYFTTFD